MTNLSRYPHVPHAGRTDTSAAAAQSIAKTHSSMQLRILDAIRQSDTGLTSDAAANVSEVNPYTARARTAELRAQGLIKDSGNRAPNMYGRPAIVWLATSAEERQQILAAKAANDEAAGGDSHAMSQPVTRDGGA